jgi:AcrR family transcriptional regulator
MGPTISAVSPRATTEADPGSATRLQTALAGSEESSGPSPIDAFKLARRKFQGAQRIDMSALALELQINRVTLYRWVGSRDQLLVEVIWSLGERTIEKIDAAVTASGSERVVQVVSRFIDTVLGHAGMRRWIADEGESAMRLLTIQDKGFQQRLIGRVEGLLEEEIGAGRLEVSADVREVAYVIVRVIESYVYLDLITGEEPEPGRAEPILRMLLR